MTTAGPRTPALPLERAAESVLLEKLPAGAYTCDPDGLITWYNKRAVQVWGRAPAINDPGDRWCGSYRMFIDGQPITHTECWMARCIQENRSFVGEEIEIERPDGTRAVVLAHANPVHDATGTVAGAVNVLVDITDRKAAEQEAHEDFLQLLDVLPAMAYTTDPDGLLTYYNRAAEEMWGRAPRLRDPEFRYCGSLRIHVNGAELPLDRCPMALALRERRPQLGQELEIERPDGSRVHALVHATPLFGKDGRLRGAVNVVIDFTPFKKAQQALKEADERKDVFLQVLGHELRNQLDPIRGAVHLLRDPRVGTTRERAGAMLQRQLETTVRIVDDVMDLARLFRGTLKLRCERFDLRGAVQSAIRTTQSQVESKGQTINVTNPPDAVELYADGSRVAQLITILIGNAVKHTPRGGNIWVSSDIEGRWGVLKVRDNGPGVSDEVLKRIFDMNAHMGRALDGTASGLGIGLALVKGLVDLHKGRIEARSVPGRGMEFVVRVPLALGSERTSDPVMRN